MGFLDPKPLTPAALDTHPRLSATALSATILDQTVRATATIPAAANSVVLMGSSTTAYTTETTATLKAFNDRGYWSWLNASMGQRLNFVANHGVGGETAGEILARMDTILSDPSVWVFEASTGSNDVIQDLAVETTKANKRAIWDALLANGRRVVTTTINPYNAATAGQKAKTAELNTWIKAQADEIPIIVVDTHTVITDPATGNWKAGTEIGDGVHSNRNGAALMAGEFFRVLAPHFRGTEVLPAVVGAPYQILSTGFFDGDTSGLATSWTHLNWNSAAAVATPSKVVRTDGKPGVWQQFVNTSAGNGFLARSNTTTGYKVGQEVYGQVEVELGSDVTDFNVLHAQISFHRTDMSALPGLAQDMRNYNNSTATPLASVPFTRGVLRTPRYVVPAETGRVMLSVTFRGMGTVRLARAGIFNASAQDAY